MITCVDDEIKGDAMQHKEDEQAECDFHDGVCVGTGLIERSANSCEGGIMLKRNTEDVGW